MLAPDLFGPFWLDIVSITLKKSGRIQKRKYFKVVSTNKKNIQRNHQCRGGVIKNIASCEHFHLAAYNRDLSELWTLYETLLLLVGNIPTFTARWTEAVRAGTKVARKRVDDRSFMIPRSHSSYFYYTYIGE